MIITAQFNFRILSNQKVLLDCLINIQEINLTSTFRAYLQFSVILGWSSYKLGNSINNPNTSREWKYISLEYSFELSKCLLRHSPVSNAHMDYPKLRGKSKSKHIQYQ